MISSWNRGSEWHRWDPHIHTPGTLFNDEFAGNWPAYFDAIEGASPAVAALGITDYCVLDSYKEFCRRRASEGRAKNIAFVFPNIEFRLTVETEKKKAVNLHLLFSPEDPQHEAEIERLLSEFQFEYKGRKYRCTPSDLRMLGRAVDPTQYDDRGALKKGAEQFKLSLENLKAAFRTDEWMRRNCLVAVCLNTSDGTAGLKSDDAFKALREELESFADVIFSSREGDRKFWLGKKAGFSREYIEATYRSLKPCLHGSDAHSIDRVLKPDGDRYCWIRSELSFTGLRQALVEPESRVSIGLQPPPGGAASETIRALQVADAHWLGTPKVEFNDGLVAIIGPKGNGKTALADTIAHSAGADISDDSSFLLKANEYLGDAEASLTWGDGTVTGAVRLSSAGQPTEWQPYVRYLSQRFVDRLCSSESLQDELVREIESVVFQAIQEEERLGASSFEQLREQRLESVLRLRDGHLSEIARLTDAIATEDKKMRDLPAARKVFSEQEKSIKALEAELKALLPKEKKQELKELSEVQVAIDVRTKAIQALKLKLQRVDGFSEEFSQVKTGLHQQLRDLRVRYADCGLTPEEWPTFAPQFSDKSDAVIAGVKTRLEISVKGLEAPPQRVATDMATWSLVELRARAEALTKEIGVESQRALKFKTTTTKLTEAKLGHTNQANLIKDLEGADLRRRTASTERRAAYAKVFEMFVREEQTLDSLYAPLRAQLAGAGPEEKRLEFCVNRRVDIEGWVSRGEDLLDLRVAGAFQGRGKLLEAAKKELLPAWLRGGADKIAEAMQAFISESGAGLSQQKRKEVTFHQLGEWLFSTDHVSLEYGIRYNGVELSRLSPGTRGIVLLMLYLAIDQWDTRPLLVDQPEENLDPQSVYEQLVPYFRLAKRRRQVILVTHNPNLVVNADADQIIVATAVRTSASDLPTISYRSGGLENEQTRQDVCRILEGGERAFRERESRYDLHRRNRNLPAPETDAALQGVSPKKSEAPKRPNAPVLGLLQEVAAPLSQ